MTDTNTPLIDIRDLHFNWPNEPDLIDIPAFQMNRRDRVFLEGESGSGKSTLLGLIAGVLQPSSGTIRFSGSELNKLSSGKRDRLRADRMGVIFQLFNLLPYLSVIENVVLPCRFSRRRKENALQRSNTIDASQTPAAKARPVGRATDPPQGLRPVRGPAATGCGCACPDRQSGSDHRG